jgi:hypothetical protein
MPLRQWSSHFVGESIIQGFNQDLETEKMIVLLYDEGTKCGISIGNGNKVLLSGPDSEFLKEFDLQSVSLKRNQAISSSSFDLLGPFFVLECEVASNDDVWAISSLYSGLLELIVDGTSNVIFYDALNALENYFIQTLQNASVSSIEVGLVGELLVIARANQPGEFVLGWHASPFSTYDFSSHSNRLEVKTSTSPSRLHILRDTQTKRSETESLTYASVYCPYAANGENVEKLISRINTKLDSAERLVFKRKLENYNCDAMNSLFDFQTGESSIKFISSANVPFPLRNDVRVLDLQWRCDFNFIDEEDSSSYWGSL